MRSQEKEREEEVLLNCAQIVPNLVESASGSHLDMHNIEVFQG